MNMTVYSPNKCVALIFKLFTYIFFWPCSYMYPVYKSASDGEVPREKEMIIGPLAIVLNSYYRI